MAREQFLKYRDGLRFTEAEKLANALRREDETLRKKFNRRGNYASVEVRKTFESASGRSEYGVFVRPLPDGDPQPPVWFDYENQAWAENGVYTRCGHPEAMACGCYGRLHEGERAEYRRAS